MSATLMNDDSVCETTKKFPPSGGGGLETTSPTSNTYKTVIATASSILIFKNLIVRDSSASLATEFDYVRIFPLALLDF